MKFSNFFTKATLLVALLMSGMLSQAQTFNHSTDLFDRDEARSIQYDPTDGGFVTAGHHTIAGSPFLSLANLVKYDAAGTTVWAHWYDFGGLNPMSRVNAVEKTNDLGYILAGKAFNPVNGMEQAFLLKTDPMGNWMWSQFYDFLGADSEAFSVEEVLTPFIGPTYICTGSFKNVNTGRLDILIILTDLFGNIISSSEFDTGMDDEGLSVKRAQPIPGGADFVVSGWTTRGVTAGKNVFVCGLDFGLNMLWSRIYGGNGDEEGRAIEVSPSGDILVGGYSNSFSNGNLDVMLSLHDPFGNPIWENIYGAKRNEEAHSVEFISDGTIAMTGWTDQLSAAGNKDAFIAKVDMGGLLLFSRAYGGSDDDIGYSIKEFVSSTGVAGGLIMGGVYGEVPMTAVDDRDIYTVRTTPGGVAPCFRNPKFRQLPIVPVSSNVVLPHSSTAQNIPTPAVDPFVAFTQINRCCTCADMMVSFFYSPTFFCSGTPVSFVNNSSCVNNFRWLVDGVVVSNATDLIYTFAAPGVYTVTLQGQNAGCPAISFSQTIVVSCGPAPRLGLEEELPLGNIQLMPNPATEFFNLEAQLSSSQEAEAWVRISDITGRVVFDQQYTVAGDQLQARINTADWTEGIYLVQVTSGQQQDTQRLMITR